MVPLVRLIIVISIVFAAIVIRLIFFVCIIAIFSFINIAFCSSICIGGKCIIITIIDLAAEHRIFCLTSINICFIYIVLG